MTKRKFFDVYYILASKEERPFYPTIAFNIGYMIARGAVDNWFNTSPFTFDDVKAAVDHQIQRFDARYIGLNLDDFKLGVDWFIHVSARVFESQSIDGAKYLKNDEF